MRTNRAALRVPVSLGLVLACFLCLMALSIAPVAASRFAPRIEHSEGHATPNAAVIATATAVSRSKLKVRAVSFDLKSTSTGSEPHGRHHAAATAAAVKTPLAAHIPANPVIETPDIMFADISNTLIPADIHAAVKAGKVKEATARKFLVWAEKMGKNYEGMEEEEKMKRLAAFAKNLARVRRHNRKHPHRKLKLNEFSDMTFDEFKATMLPPVEFNATEIMAGKGVKVVNAKTAVRSADLPASADWTASGVVTEARQQGACGSCYAFASAAAIESLVAISYGQSSLTYLSPQQIVDCSADYGNFGCGGGFAAKTLDYVINSGLTFDSDYPYVGQAQGCGLASGMTGWFIKNRYTLDTPCESCMQEYLLEQPMTVAIHATSDFKSLGWDIFTGPCSSSPSDLNHAVLLVGYGTENGQDYWLIKNSWGTTWGYQGFGRIERNAGDVGGAGRCGIALVPAWPSM